MSHSPIAINLYKTQTNKHMQKRKSETSLWSKSIDLRFNYSANRNGFLSKRPSSPQKETYNIIHFSSWTYVDMIMNRLMLEQELTEE